jgi:hypothetical protein
MSIAYTHRVTDFYFDDDKWVIRFLIVNTSNWWLGHQVLIAPKWIDDVSWTESTVSVGLTRQAVKNALHYDPIVTLDREQEAGIHEHYGRRGFFPSPMPPPTRYALRTWDDITRCP